VLGLYLNDISSLLAFFGSFCGTILVIAVPILASLKHLKDKTEW